MPRIASKALFFNYKLFLAAIFLMGLGLLAIYSVSFNDQGFNNFKRQIVFSLIALFVFLAVSRLNYGIWENYARGFYLIGIILMFLVLFIGEKKHGTYGWLGFASYHIQPIEVMKIGVILILAKYFSKVRMDDKRYRHIFISSTYCILPIVLALFQPDFGSAAIIGFIWFLIVLTWGMRRRYLIYMMAAVLLLGVTLWLFFLRPYQKARIAVFLNPNDDPMGSGYHVLQSITAIGSGRIWGKGLGYGSQSQLHFLPEAHTDFIYAVIGEELGFVGIAGLILGFAYLFWEMYKIAVKSADNFGRFIVVAVIAMFFAQFLVNTGMNIGLVPVTGLPLPFVSYGGSALVVELFLLGLVFNISSVSRKSEGYR